MKAYNPYTNLLFVAVALLFTVSCEKEPEPDPDPDPGISNEILTINNWIWEGLNDLYLWEEFIPNLDPDLQKNPEAFFYKLLYSADHDSWIVDDYEALLARFEGVELATGISMSAGILQSNQVVGVVEFVSPGSPAEDSGVVRGDVIVTIDGKYPTRDDYFDLYYQNTATFGFGSWDGTRMVLNGKTAKLTATELSQNPFVHREVIDYQGKKIGYFVYTSFTPGPNDEWLEEINTVLGEFQTAGVSEVIVDLRYNGGGYMYVTAQMASILGPASAVANHSILASQVWNDGYTQYWKESDLDNDGQPDGDESGRLLIRLPDSDLNLNLSNLYFLTSPNTASASELLMVGLDPYMNVVQVGDTTYGKCYGSVTVDDWANPKRHNWAMQPIVLKYSNAIGYTDFVDGIPPDFYEVEDWPFFEPFGSVDDPLLAEALTQITGVAPATKKSAFAKPGVKLLTQPRKQIPEQLINLPDKPGSTVIF